MSPWPPRREPADGPAALVWTSIRTASWILDAIIQNFVAITNTHPTMAVTVHFRYFNDNCDDILDFLVILTCNDTLLFDPFNFEIPGSDGENTKDRIFGPKRPGHVLSPVPTAFYGSGRFIMTASAARCLHRRR